MDSENGELETAEGPSITGDQVPDAIREVLSHNNFNRWTTDTTLELGDRRWRPHAISPDGTEVLYVALHSELPRFVVDRLERAEAHGLRSKVALSIAGLFVSETVTALARVEAEVLVLDDPDERWRATGRHVLCAMADLQVPVTHEVRREIGEVIWPRLSVGSAHVKGRRLEAILAFLFSQVDDMRVVSRNFKGETDEIDRVLQLDGASSRVWQRPGVPFILVEAKNRVEKADQPDVSTLITKLQTKRGSANFGFLVATGGFTTAAALQETKFATAQNVCIPMIDGERLGQLLQAERLDDELERVVREALLR